MGRENEKKEQGNKRLEGAMSKKEGDTLKLLLRDINPPPRRDINLDNNFQGSWQGTSLAFLSTQAPGHQDPSGSLEFPDGSGPSSLKAWAP